MTREQNSITKLSVRSLTDHQLSDCYCRVSVRQELIEEVTS